MKNYVLYVKNNNTGEIEHVATSNLQFNHNPYDTLSSTHSFEYYEFDNDADNTLVRARELLNTININTGEIPLSARADRFNRIRRTQ